MQIPEFLERVAREIHQRYLDGDNQSTTTVCLYSGTNTLYVATQGDKLPLQALLQAASISERHAQLCKTLPAASSGGYSKLSVNAVRATGAHEPPSVWEIVDRLSRELGYFAPLNASNIAAAKWVTRFDLLCTGAQLQGTGFHGESYIIRYFALKGLHGVQGFASNTEQLEQGGDSSELIGQLTEHFKQVYGERLYMASSQGACSRCAQFMETLGIRFHSTQDRESEREDTWVHPFTMTTRQSGYRPYSVTKFWLAPKIAEIAGAKKKKRQMDI